MGPLGLVAGSCVLSSCLSESQAPAGDPESVSDTPWAYHELDPDVTAARAYDECAKGHCMYGVFAAVVAQLGERYGAPYRSFPLGMMRYGAGGTGGSGSLCGALNGSAALIGLFVGTEEEMKQLVTEMSLWYEQTEMPLHVPAKPALDIEIPKSAAHSVLCHVSATRWCRISGHKAFSKPRKERCRRLTADTARRTVEILNSYHRHHFARAHALSEDVKKCTSCHARGSEKENTNGSMNCGSCHFSLAENHPPL